MSEVTLADPKGHKYVVQSTPETVADGPRLKLTIRTADTGAKVIDLVVDSTPQRRALLRMLDEL